MKYAANEFPQQLTRRQWLESAGLLATGFSIGCCGCHSAPLTNRPQLLLVGKGQEVSLGADAYEQTLQETPLSRNSSAAEMVRRVGQRIADVSGKPEFAWRFELLQSDQQNAFCLPGGKVAVYEGILPLCQTEGGLAVVMSHEVAHAIARHGSERMTHSMASDTIKQGVQMIASAKMPNRKELVMAAYGAASQYGVILPYSRKHESEADHIGVMLMADAGYDPSEAPRFWTRFGQGGKGQPEFFSTHPSDERRSNDLQKLLPEANQRYSSAATKFGVGEQVPI